MQKVLIWGTGRCYESHILILKYYEMIGEIQIAGVTSAIPYFSKLDGYDFISKEDIRNIEFDYLVIVNSFLEIRNEANELGIPDSKILDVGIFRLPNLDLDKYIKLKNSNVSILSNHCWGALQYSNLGLQFASPFINMYERSFEYIKILKNLEQYLAEPLKLKSIGFDKRVGQNYPICLLNDVELHMFHYENFEIAERKWYERKSRLNMDNLFVSATVLEEKEAEEFETLDYSKKICFVPFKTDLPSAVSLKHIYDKSCEKNFYDFLCACAIGRYKAYDPIELLLNGKFNNERIMVK